MVRARSVSVIFVCLVITNFSSASVGSNFRKLITSNTTNGSTDSQVSPLASPPPASGDKELNSSRITGSRDKDAKPKEPLVGDNSTVVPVESENNNGTAVPTANLKKNDKAEKKTDNSTNSTIKPKKNNETKEEKDNSMNLQPGTNWSCDGSATWCKVPTGIFACIKAGKRGYRDLMLVVQNVGEKKLKVNVNIPTSVDAVPAFEILKGQTKEIKLSSAVGETTTVKLNAGGQDCELHLDRSFSMERFKQQLSLYSKQVTPIYGAYLFFVLALFFGGTWACCKLTKRRRSGEIPYQELEMGLPESASAVNVYTPESWDDDWDDDWDENNAVMSPGGSRIGSISANGLTARPAKKDGWENDWDDTR